MSSLKNYSAIKALDYIPLFDGKKYVDRMFANMIISSLHDMRQSPEQLISLLMGTFPDMYAEKPKGDSKANIDSSKLLSSITSQEQLASTNKKFDDYMRRTTDIVYDIAMNTVAGNSAVLRDAIKKAVLKEPSEFNSLITELFTKLFGNPLQNRSIVYQIVDDLITAMFKESQRIRSEAKATAEKIKFDASEKIRLEREQAAAQERARLEQEITTRLEPIIKARLETEKEQALAVEKLRLEKEIEARLEPIIKAKLEKEIRDQIKREQEAAKSGTNFFKWITP